MSRNRVVPSPSRIELDIEPGPSGVFACSMDSGTENVPEKKVRPRCVIRQLKDKCLRGYSGTGLSPALEMAGGGVSSEHAVVSSKKQLQQICFTVHGARGDKAGPRGGSSSMTRNTGGLCRDTGLVSRLTCRDC